MELLRRRLKQSSDKLNELGHKANRKLRLALRQRKETAAALIGVKKENSAPVEGVRDLQACMNVLKADTSGIKKHVEVLAASVETFTAYLQHQCAVVNRLRDSIEAGAADSATIADEARKNPAEKTIIQCKEQDATLKQREDAMEEISILKVAATSIVRKIGFLKGKVSAMETALTNNWLS